MQGLDFSLNNCYMNYMSNFHETYCSLLKEIINKDNWDECPFVSIAKDIPLNNEETKILFDKVIKGKYYSNSNFAIEFSPHFFEHFITNTSDSILSLWLLGDTITEVKFELYENKPYHHFVMHLILKQEDEMPIELVNTIKQRLKELYQ